jgi:hypothetical protein
MLRCQDTGVERFAVPAALAHEVCDRLGTAPPGDAAGVADLYRRWCAQVPFDPVAKAVAVAKGHAIPGGDPVEVLRRWLESGLGSTCWGHVAALAGILEGADVRTTVGVDRMLTDELVDFHCFVVAHLDEGPVALDPVHVSGDPLPVAPGATGNHPAYAVGFDAGDGRLEHWFAPPFSEGGPRRYAVLTTTADAGDVRAFCAVSGRFSGVTAHRFFLRRCPPDAFSHARPSPDGRSLSLRRWQEGGVDERTIVDLQEALAALGCTSEVADALRRAGFVHPDGTGWRWTT